MFAEESIMTPTRSQSAPVSRRAGFTLIELLIVVAIIGVVATIAIPGLSSARAGANEASAIGSARTASSAQAAYASSCGDGSYAPSALQLSTGGYVAPDFVLPVKHGFAFTLGVGDLGVLGPVDCDGNPTVTDFYFSATPTSPSLGRRGFAVDETGGIWVDLAGVAPVEPFVEGGTIAPLR
jgi:prepilin-type N-terminal cleavage/methylation domain-containing protein